MVDPRPKCRVLVVLAGLLLGSAPCAAAPSKPPPDTPGLPAGEELNVDIESWRPVIDGDGNITLACRVVLKSGRLRTDTKVVFQVDPPDAPPKDIAEVPVKATELDDKRYVDVKTEVKKGTIPFGKDLRFIAKVPPDPQEADPKDNVQETDKVDYGPDVKATEIKIERKDDKTLTARVHYVRQNKMDAPGFTVAVQVAAQKPGQSYDDAEWTTVVNDPMDTFDDDPDKWSVNDFPLKPGWIGKALWVRAGPKFVPNQTVQEIDPDKLNLETEYRVLGNAKPNIVVQNLVPELDRKTRILTIVPTLANYGGGDTGQFWCGLWRAGSDKPLEEYEHNNIAWNKGQKYVTEVSVHTFKLPVNTPDGETLKFHYEADSRDSVDEEYDGDTTITPKSYQEKSLSRDKKNGYDNTWIFEVKVPPAPEQTDLEIGSVTAFYAGKNLHYGANISNLGDDIAEDVTFKWTADGKPIPKGSGIVTIGAHDHVAMLDNQAPAVHPGKSTEVVLTVISGGKTIKSKPVTVKPSADKALVVCPYTAIGFRKEKDGTADKLIGGIVLFNKGTKPAKNVKVGVRLGSSGSFETREYPYVIPPGAKKVLLLDKNPLTIPASLAGATTHLEVEILDKSLLASPEDALHRGQNFTVPRKKEEAKFDVSVELQPHATRDGKTVEISAVVSNRGPGRSLGTWAYFAVDNAMLEKDSKEMIVRSLAKGEATTLTVKATPKGTATKLTAHVQLGKSPAAFGDGNEQNNKDRKDVSIDVPAAKKAGKKSK